MNLERIQKERPCLQLFSSSAERNEHRAGSDSKIVEQGFIGSHTDIGGGYASGDLSDVSLQWMFNQAVSAGVKLGEGLKNEHKTIDSPVLHDDKLISGLPSCSIRLIRIEAYSMKMIPLGRKNSVYHKIWRRIYATPYQKALNFVKIKLGHLTRSGKKLRRSSRI